MAENMTVRAKQLGRRFREAMGRGLDRFWKGMEAAARSGAYCVDQEFGVDAYCAAHVKAGIDDGASLAC